MTNYQNILSKKLQNVFAEHIFDDAAKYLKIASLEKNGYISCTTMGEESI